MTPSWRWEHWDKSIYLVNPWIDKRAKIDFAIDRRRKIKNDTIPKNPKDYSMGQNVVYTATEVRETHFIINGMGNPGNKYNDRHIQLTGHRCAGSCNEAVKEKEQEDRVRRWSVAKDWESDEQIGKVPVEGEEVHIEPGWNMIFDMDKSPVYKLIRVNGKLTFDPSKATHL